jgi:hypothetical protein
MTVDYRTWITVARLPHEEEAMWLPLIGRLEMTQASLGPVISWEDDTTAQIVLSFKAESESDAAARAVGILVEALQAVGLGDRFPKVIDVEPIAQLVGSR